MIYNNYVREVFSKLVDKMGLEQTIINSVIIVGVTLIYIYVTYNFISTRKRKNKQKKEVRSVVETTTMSAFFMGVAFIVNYNIGTFSYHNIYLVIIFLVVYIIGTMTNLLGRFYLGKNWGNNVIIYKDQTLVTNGVYKIVRHPLYASIIWMIYSIGVLKENYLVFILNTFVFIPFMYYRAKQEETELRKEFKDYDEYIKKTGMFFPNVIKMFRKD